MFDKGLSTARLPSEVISSGCSCTGAPLFALRQIVSSNNFYELIGSEYHEPWSLMDPWSVQTHGKVPPKRNGVSIVKGTIRWYVVGTVAALAACSMHI